MHLCQVVVVGALHRREVSAVGRRATLVLVVESGRRHQVRREPVIALVRNLVAVGNNLIPFRIDPGEVQQHRARDRVAVGARDCHGVAEAVSIRIEGPGSGLRPQVVLLALARHSVARSLVEVGRCLVVHRARKVKVLILFGRAVRHVIKVPRIGHARRIHAIVHRGANLRVPIQLPA